MELIRIQQNGSANAAKATIEVTYEMNVTPTQGSVSVGYANAARDVFSGEPTSATGTAASGNFTSVGKWQDGTPDTLTGTFSDADTPDLAITFATKIALDFKTVFPPGHFQIE